MLAATMSIQSLINDLISAGWTQERIAERVVVGQAAISKLRTGKRKDMRYQNAKRLEQLHAEVCGIWPELVNADHPAPAEKAAA